MAQPQQKVSLSQLALSCLYIGITGYGGGPAIIALMHRYFIEQREWVHEEDFKLALSLSQLLPGAQAASVITFLGFRLGGGIGALLAPLGLIGPATALMIMLSAVYFAYGSMPAIHAMFVGLGAVVVALLLYAVLSMGRMVLRDRRALPIAFLAFLAFTGLNWLQQQPHYRYLRNLPLVLLVVIVAALLGLIVYRKLPLADGAAVPAEDESTLPSRWLWIGWIVAAIVLAILLWLTRQTGISQLVLASLRVGAFSFGGGYAAIPFFQHEALSTHHWLDSSREFLDGVALGQVTPGPVLITATFIGYKVAGILGALLSTLAVFAPGVIATYFLAQWHQQISRLAWLQAMVRGIVAAFIGLLLSVTIQFAIASLTDWRTITMAVIAAIVLIIWRKDPLWVILGAAIISPFLFHR